MKENSLRHIVPIKIILALLLVSFFSSCILFKKKCPVPTCEIRKTHRHLLIFSNEEKAKKEKGNKKNNLVSDSSLVDVDSSGTASHDHNHDEVESKATYIEVDGTVLDEEGNVYVDPKEQKKKDRQKKKAEKKAKRKKKKEDKLRAKGQFSEEEQTEEGTYEDEDEEEGNYANLTEEEYKNQRLKEYDGDTVSVRSYNEKELAKQLRKEDRKKRREERKANRKARKGKRGQADYTRLYRSRVTKWWRFNQNPKTGKYYRRKKNESTDVG